MFRLPFIRPVEQGGQSTAEYALVLLGVAAVALALLTWAAGGKMASFFDAIFAHLIKSVG
jgi:hypothetical protein